MPDNKYFTHGDFQSHKYESIEDALDKIKKILIEHEASVPKDTVRLFNYFVIAPISYTHPIDDQQEFNLPEGSPIIPLATDFQSQPKEPALNKDANTMARELVNTHFKGMNLDTAKLVLRIAGIIIDSTAVLP